MSALTPPTHTTMSFPRKQRRGGGIAVVINKDISSHVKVTQITSYSTFEAVGLTLNFMTHNVNFTCIYRPPHSRKNKTPNSTVIEQLNSLVSSISTKPGHPVLLGDFNFPYNRPTAEVMKLQDVISSNNMIQIINSPTHKAGNLLDWVVVRNENDYHARIIDNLISDHKTICLDIDIVRPETSTKRVISRNIKAINLVTLKSDLVTALELPEGQHVDIEDWDSTVTEVLEKHAPLKERKLKDRPHTPWYTEAVKDAKKRCRKAEKDWKKSGLVVHKEIFRTSLTFFKSVIKEAKVCYFLNEFGKEKSCKQQFDLCNKLLGKPQCASLPNNSNDKESANKFAIYFKDKIETIRKELDQYEIIQEPKSFNGPQLILFQPVTQTFVKNIILKAPKKSCELDPLPSNVLLDCLDELIPSITDIINYSLSKGIFPPSFRTALVRPLLKKPSLDQNVLKNYRPVSNLPFLSKILEKVVLHQILIHLKSNNLTETFQSAYREHHSTETALLRVLNDLLLEANDNKISLLTLLDLSAAFDTIDHGILLNRLHHTFGINGVCLDWFRSYLTDRHQTVVVNGAKSANIPLQYGVPQGSVLGPVLFSMYMKPLGDVISKHKLQYHFYADDTQIYHSCTISEISSLIHMTEKCLLDVKNWTNRNRLKLNEDKTEVIITSRPNIDRSFENQKIMVGESEVALSCSAVKNLGVCFDSSLSMTKHINHQIRNMYNQIRNIAKIRKFLPKEIASLMVNALVLSRLDYCNSLLSNIPLYDIKRLQVVQNNAARLVLRKSRLDSPGPLLKELHWLPVEKRIHYKICTIVFKIFHDCVPYKKTC